MQLLHLVDYLGICGDKDNTRRCWAWHHKQQDNDDDHHDDHDHGDHFEVGGYTQGSLKLYTKKLEVI